MEKNSYFISILPPQPYLDSINKLKQDFSEKYACFKSLNSPSHITLHMPFKKYEKDENKIFESLSLASREVEKFSLILKDFGCFAPRVIFINVLENLQLRELQKTVTKYSKVHLQQFNDTYRNKGFHPHLTIAFRDLKKAQFAMAWEEYSQKKYESEFEVTHIWLLKHDGKKWQPYKSFELGGIYER